MRKKLMSTVVALALTGITLSAYADNFCGFSVFLKAGFPAGTVLLNTPTADGVSLANQISGDNHSFNVPGSIFAFAQQSDINARYGIDNSNYCDLTIHVNRVTSASVDATCQGNFKFDKDAFAQSGTEKNVYWLTFTSNPVVLSDKG